MIRFAFLVVVALCGSLVADAYAQRPGGSMAGGCQRGGMTTFVPPMSLGMPLTTMPSMATGLTMGTSSMASGSLQQFNLRQMQQALTMQQMQQAALREQQALDEQDQSRQRKLATRQRLREEQQAKRAAARAKNAEPKLASQK